MDEEQSFAALLRSSTPASRPTWNAPSTSDSADPWANPFASSPTQPFGAPAVPVLPDAFSVDASVPYAGAGAGAPAGAGESARAGFGESETYGGFEDVGGFGAIAGAGAGVGEIAGGVGMAQKESPYVRQLEHEGIRAEPASAPALAASADTGGFGADNNKVDPPSVIAAREREALSAQHAFQEPEPEAQSTTYTPASASAFVPRAGASGSVQSAFDPNGGFADDPFAQPFSTGAGGFGADPSTRPFVAPLESPVRPVQTTSGPTSPSPSKDTTRGGGISVKQEPRNPLAGLIDEDLMAESDPMLSLKKAFVKSTPGASASASASASAAASGSATGAEGRAGLGTPRGAKGKTYVFTPSPRKGVGAGAGAARGETKGKEVKTAAPPSQSPRAAVPKQDPVAEKEVEVAKPVVVDEARDVSPGQPQRPSGVAAGRQPGPEDGDGKVGEAGAVHGGAEAGKPAEPQDSAGAGDSVTREAGSQDAVASEEAAASVVAGDAIEIVTEVATASSNRSEETSATAAPPAPTLRIEADGADTLVPSDIPLPASAAVTPGITREATPAPEQTSQAEVDPPAPSSAPAPQNQSGRSTVDSLSSPVPAQPARDRVAVSPLDAPAPAREEADYGFKALSIGGSATASPAVPQDAMAGWGDGPLNGDDVGSHARFSGRGWGAVDDDLFGEGGRGGDPWAGGEGAVGWETANAGSSPTPEVEADAAPFASPGSPPTVRQSQSPTTTTPRSRRKTHPVFSVSISDPTRMGDPVRGYTVYTVRTRTTSPHYRKSDLTALRRFSDFLWLFDALIANNPGIVVPPVPDKHTFGRFQEQFIETRRLALERSLNKITSHPVLQLDPDLRLFLESDSFAHESKARQPDPDARVAVSTSGGSGLLSISGWTGSGRYVESDDWFASRGAFLDSLEAQLKGLSKAVDAASKTRLELALSLGEGADAMGRLAESDLGSAMCAALARLADLGRREREAAEEMAKGDVVNLLNLADEYIRFIGSVRIAMGGRVKLWYAWQVQVKEGAKFKAQREKLRAQGKLGDRAAQSLAEVNELERRAQDAEREFVTISKVVKSEFARFERERVEAFKVGMVAWLDEQIVREKEVLAAWEEYHGVVLRMVQKAQGIKEGRAA